MWYFVLRYGTININIKFLSAPSLAQTKLSSAFNEIGPEANAAKKGLARINEKWNEISSDDRSALVLAFQVSAGHFDKFARADEDPVGAVKATIDIVSRFTALAGPSGQIVSVALSFVSGFLSLFGIGKTKAKKPDFSKIIRKEIDDALNRYYDKVLHDEVAGTLHNFVISKAYVDSLSRSGGKLTEHQALTLQTNVPLWSGLKFLGKLDFRIRELLGKNERNSVDKLLTYIELYTKVASFKDLILLQSITLLPDQRNQAALLAAQLALRNKQKKLLEFLFNAKVNSKMAVRYFDPDLYPVTDKYLSALLKVPDFDRSMAGVWCITLRGGMWSRSRPVGFMMMYRQLMKDGHPYLMSGGYTCRWKLVPHGNDLYTIVANDWRCRHKRGNCGQYLSHDTIDSHKMRMTVESDADFWEITGDKYKR